MKAETRKNVLTWMQAHHGLITAAKAMEFGLNRDQIKGLVRRGVWESVHRGVYRLVGSPASIEQTHLAAVWRCGDNSYVTAGPALGLWGIERFSAALDPVVLVPADRSIDGVDFEIRRRPELEAGDRTIWRGVPIATRTRALVDLAMTTRSREFRVAFDAVRRVRGTDPQRLRRRAEAALPQQGALYVIRLADSGLLDMESEPERDFFAIMQSVTPSLAVQYYVLPDIRVDFAWPDARIVIEYDGGKHHTLPTDRAHDRRRRARIRAAGWTVLLVRAEHLRDPDRLRRRLSRRRRECLTALPAQTLFTGGR